MDPLDDPRTFDYELPPELIAREPLAERDASRLLVLERGTGAIQHRRVADLPELLSPGDCLVFNDTQVIPARVFGVRVSTGGRWEGLYLGTTPDGTWRLIGQTRGRMRPGEVVRLDPVHPERGSGSLVLTFTGREPDGTWLMASRSERPPLELLAQLGTMPLPPYIGRKSGSDLDWQRYQTVYASRPGAIAAPTAGLHFTPELLQACTDRGIRQARVTLHVGVGTFRPISADRLSDHQMHAEWGELSPETARVLNETRQAGRRIVAVGTTSVRTLESLPPGSSLEAWQGETRLFIRPPYAFRHVDALLTNFHLPRSTLLVLVSALAGVEPIRAAYAAAVAERYRFFSYGDAMLIL